MKIIKSADQKRIIRLPVCGIAITLFTPETLDGVTVYGGGEISSNLHEDMEDFYEASVYNAVMDGIEALILGHAMAGVDVESPAYLEGIESAIEGAANNV